MDRLKDAVDASKRVRYAVVGLGHIAQAAVLPAFRHAKENSQLTALVSDDSVKLEELGKKFKVRNLYSYREYDACLTGDAVDAVYIALPNHLHAEYAIRSAEAGRHVLCEKPMAVTEDECRRMIAAAKNQGVRLMIAYRLHFEAANLETIELVRAGKIGEPRYFESSFSMQVNEGNIRLDGEKGGGALYDIGIYCINAARCLFRQEPEEVLAMSAFSGDARFTEVDETTSVILRFPEGRLASFTASFGAAHTSSFRIVGSKGDIRLEPAYSYADKLTYYLTIDGATSKKSFRKRDQFAPELLYFSKCVQDGREPEPSGLEGLADVRIIEALYRSSAEGRPICLSPAFEFDYPTGDQEIHRPAVSQPELVHVDEPHS